MPGNLQSIPASVIASWPPPNYDNPERRAWMPIFGGILQCVTTVLFTTRLGLRAGGQAGGFGLDDALLVPAFLAGTVFTAFCLLASESYGMDRHIWDVRPERFEKIVLAGWAAQLAFLVSTCSTKISVLLFYRRLTEGSCHKLWKYLIVGAIAFTASYCIALVLALIFNCSPTDAYWKSYDPKYTANYHCTDTKVLNPLSGALSILSDVYSVLLPMAIMAKLKATRRQKIALNVVFSFGFLVVGAGVARTYYLERLGTHWDITWLGFDVLVWSQLELQLAIICASAPALRVLFRRYLSSSMTRAMITSKLSSGRNVPQQQHSPPDDTEAIISYSSKQCRRSMEHSNVGAAAWKKKDVEASVKSIDDMDDTCYPINVRSSTTLNMPVQTPEAFETFALENLREQRRHFIR
ncbi:hypothetical protein CBER1_05157 [Cercospora berteroae]|uniref:Rhodopsin domain-containing protein n=1 Tax=Cercospora berteroae TaxID=357750 RepID=A0A2S6C3C2_9PEZI|nr:hypothetical protein CBER1_05157 [Cercospora berteroae]